MEFLLQTISSAETKRRKSAERTEKEKSDRGRAKSHAGKEI